MLPSRNLLYQTKKSLLNNEDPSPDLPAHEQLNLLRNLVRRQETDILRLQAHNTTLQLKTQHLESSLKLSHLQSTTSPSPYSSLPPPPPTPTSPSQHQTTALHQELTFLRQTNSQLNATKNQSQRDCRSLLASNESMQRRIRQLEILEEMRRERFESELNSLTPIIIHDNETNQLLLNGTSLLLETLRQGIVKIISDVFVQSASTAEKKKVSSVILFAAGVNELRGGAVERSGLAVMGKVYQGLRDLVKLVVDEGYGEIEAGKEEQRSQWNAWLERSIAGVKGMKQQQHGEQQGGKKGAGRKEEECLYLFRLLALHYRVKFPLKGEVDSVDQDLQVVLDDLIVGGLDELIVKK